MAQFGERLYTVAQRHGVEHAAELVVPGDGAPVIWELAALHYPQATQILDFFHVSEHFHALRARAWPAPDDPHGDRWLRAQVVRLKRGWWATFIAAFHALPPLTGAHDQPLRYFLINRDRMQYCACRAPLVHWQRRGRKRLHASGDTPHENNRRTRGPSWCASHHSNSGCLSQWRLLSTCPNSSCRVIPKTKLHPTRMCRMCRQNELTKQAEFAILPHMQGHPHNFGSLHCSTSTVMHAVFGADLAIFRKQVT